MKLRGMELPVNSVIIIALAVFVLLILSSFLGKSGSELDRTQVQNAFNQGCSQLSSAYHCNQNDASNVKTAIISNGRALSFLEVCRSYFRDPSMSSLKCTKNCPTCDKPVFEGTPCEVEGDCITPATSQEDWSCVSLNGGDLQCHAQTPQEVPVE